MRPLWGIWDTRWKEWFLEPRFSSISAVRSAGTDSHALYEPDVVPRRSDEPISKAVFRTYTKYARRNYYPPWFREAYPELMRLVPSV